MFSRRRNHKQRVVIVLEGIKACEENTGVAPLSLALHDVVGPEDQVLVLTLLYWNTSTTAPALAAAGAGTSSVSDHDNNDFGTIQTYCEALINPNIKFLYQEIIQRKETYAKVLKPFYLTCQTYGVSIFINR